MRLLCSVILKVIMFSVQRLVQKHLLLAVISQYLQDSSPPGECRIDSFQERTGLYSIGSGRFNQTLQIGTRVGTGYGVTEIPVFAPDNKRPYRVFGEIVVYAKTTIIAHTYSSHNPHHHLSVLLTELSGAAKVEQIEALLPWNLSPEQASLRYNALPRP